LAPVVERFDTTRTTHHDQEANAALKRQQRDASVVDLQAIKQRWLPSLERDLPGFNTSGFTDSKVPEDAVAQSHELRSRVEGRVRDGAQLPYVDTFLTSLTATEERVEAATRAAYEADTQAQQAADEHHAVAVELDDELIAFRKVARIVLGSRHRDYRKLRARLSRQELEHDLEPDDADGEQPAEPQTRAVEAG
jgi:hypothetical protein